MEMADLVVAAGGKQNTGHKEQQQEITIARRKIQTLNLQVFCTSHNWSSANHCTLPLKVKGHAHLIQHHQVVVALAAALQAQGPSTQIHDHMTHTEHTVCLHWSTVETKNRLLKSWQVLFKKQTNMNYNYPLTGGGGGGGGGVAELTRPLKGDYVKIFGEKREEKL